MRRFSQRNPLVTLSDINITPLLDLAFVLLIIFVITTPLLEQSINLDLPDGGGPDQNVDRQDIRTVEVGQQGIYRLDGRQMNLAQLEQALVYAHRTNPNTIVRIRADENAYYKFPVAVFEVCQRNGITRFALATDPPER